MKINPKTMKVERDKRGLNFKPVDRLPKTGRVMTKWEQDARDYVAAAMATARTEVF